MFQNYQHGNHQHALVYHFLDSTCSFHPHATTVYLWNGRVPLRNGWNETRGMGHRCEGIDHFEWRHTDLQVAFWNFCILSDEGFHAILPFLDDILNQLSLNTNLMRNYPRYKQNPKAAVNLLTSPSSSLTQKRKQTRTSTIMYFVLVKMQKQKS